MNWFKRIPKGGWISGLWLAIRRGSGSIDESALIRESGLFDAYWYVTRHPGAADYGDPVAHYVARGARLGYAPHPLFLHFWYREKNPDAVISGLTPLAHFVLEGEARGASPHPLYDPAWYRRQDPSLRDLRQGLFLHFVTKGSIQGLSPHAAFDPQHYVRTRPDIAEEIADPFTHFMTTGAVSRYSPNPLFDTAWYLSRYADIAAGSMNPLVHYLVYGAAEGRIPHPDVDIAAHRANDAACPAAPVAAYLHLLARERARPGEIAGPRRAGPVRGRILRSGLFDPDAYLSYHEDVRNSGINPLEHLLDHGLREGRRFTSPETVARLLAGMEDELGDAFAAHERDAATSAAERELVRDALIKRGARIGVYCNTQGNFFMAEIAELLVSGLQAQGVSAVSRTEKSEIDEALDLRVFVAPHEFFYLGTGARWTRLAAAPNSVLYNVEQAQTQWFGRGFHLLLHAPLVMDINIQSSLILRKAGCNAVHFMPGFLPQGEFTRPRPDMSDVELVKGYAFAGERYDWQARDEASDRPIDILFVGSSSPRRDRALTRMRELADRFRFVCVYTRQDAPLRAGSYRATSTPINCALGQRAKIVLNIHRDWLGYFEWSRLVLQGLWQGACVVTDPCLPNPVFKAGAHFLEESTPHLGELIRWLLTTRDGRERLDAARRAGYRRAQDMGSMDNALYPVMRAYNDLLTT